jgi:hypothetical protein
MVTLSEALNNDGQHGAPTLALITHCHYSERKTKHINSQWYKTRGQTTLNRVTWIDFLLAISRTFGSFKQ